MEGDDFVEYLASEAGSGSAAFHTFLTTYQGPGEVHVFYEGAEDAAFYGQAIRSRAKGRPVHRYVCKGKDAVVGVRELTSNGDYEDVVRLFFIDRDYDDLFGSQVALDERTYITDGYSFENDLVTPNALEILICDFAGLTPANPEYPAAIAGFQNLQSASLRQMASLMGWALALRERGDPVVLKNVDLKHVVAVTADGEVNRKKNGFDKFRKACAPQSAPPKLSDVRRWRKCLLALPEPLSIRGKFHLWLFESYNIAFLTEAIPKAKARGCVGVRVPISVRQRLSLDVLAGRLPPSRSLCDFLDSQLVAA